MSLSKEQLSVECAKVLGLLGVEFLSSEPFDRGRRLELACTNNRKAHVVGVKLADFYSVDDAVRAAIEQQRVWWQDEKRYRPW